MKKTRPTGDTDGAVCQRHYISFATLPRYLFDFVEINLPA